MLMGLVLLESGAGTVAVVGDLDDDQRVQELGGLC